MRRLPRLLGGSFPRHLFAPINVPVTPDIDPKPGAMTRPNIQGSGTPMNAMPVAFAIQNNALVMEAAIIPTKAPRIATRTMKAGESLLFSFIAWSSSTYALSPFLVWGTRACRPRNCPFGFGHRREVASTSFLQQEHKLTSFHLLPSYRMAA